MADVDELLSSCLYFNCNKLARIIGKMADEEFRITGLSPTLAFLISIVNDKEGTSQKDIGEKLHMTPSTITRFIDKLENKGLVLRKSDGKNTSIYLTEKGITLQADICTAWYNLHQRYSEILGEEEEKKLANIICKISSKLEEKQ